MMKNFGFQISDFRLTPTARSARVRALSIRNPQSAIRTAFTLVELMISIALVLIIMLGINYVFRMTGQTISSGQALNDQVRNNRGAQAVMFDDFSRAATDGPFITLRNRAFAGFVTKADMDADRDFNPAGDARTQQDKIRTIDLDGNGIEGEAAVGGEKIAPLTYNSRNHRVDITAFFARGLFSRQTGNDDILMADQKSNEAYIYYGHLCLPNNDGSFDITTAPTGKTNPGFGNPTTNPNNFYASSWTLSRIAMLMREPDASATIKDRQGNPQRYIQSGSGLSPLSLGSTASPGSPVVRLQDCRFDLAGISMAGFRTKLRNYIPLNPAAEWWVSMLLGQPNGARFECNPTVVRPLNSAAFSQQAPIFLRSCSQFIVEYAGDFVKQNLDPTDTAPGGTGEAAGKYGDVQDCYTNEGGTDGQIDFVIVPSTRERRIRWYGLPRDTNADGVIRADQGDVVPLRDLWNSAVAPTAALPANAPFERAEYPTANPVPLTSNYLSPAVLNTVESVSTNPTYTCAWGPDDTVRPQLIRVTIVLDDPSGKLAEGQTLEYVFSLPQ